MKRLKYYLKSKSLKILIILTIVAALLYLLISLFFKNHFFFNTYINGVHISLASYEDIDKILENYSADYNLKLIERNGDIQIIRGRDIGFKYNEKSSTYKLKNTQNLFKWIGSLYNPTNYIIPDAFNYSENKLLEVINDLNCLNGEIIEPKDVEFLYDGNSYKLIKEVYGNKINKDRLITEISSAMLKGKEELSLEGSSCYIQPKYTINSNKTQEAYDILNTYIKSKITYTFGDAYELADSTRIHKWLYINENLDVIINEEEVEKYLRDLSQKYNTAGTTRKFLSSSGEIVKVKGGIYGWIIDADSETLALIEHIKKGDTITKEPKFTQRALEWGKNDIGNTYVEISIRDQYIWFYKYGELLTEGSIVSGNPNKGNATVLGVYPLIYKQENAVLRGEDYASPVSYWMPFFGNIGIHDATWRSSFGGNIYLRNGSHGCINTPKEVAKIIYENVESGIPIVCY